MKWPSSQSCCWGKCTRECASKVDQVIFSSVSSIVFKLPSWLFSLRFDSLKFPVSSNWLHQHLQSHWTLYLCRLIDFRSILNPIGFQFATHCHLIADCEHWKTMEWWLRNGGGIMPCKSWLLFCLSLMKRCFQSKSAGMDLVGYLVRWLMCQDDELWRGQSTLSEKMETWPPAEKLKKESIC